MDKCPRCNHKAYVSLTRIDTYHTGWGCLNCKSARAFEYTCKCRDKFVRYFADEPFKCLQTQLCDKCLNKRYEKDIKTVSVITKPPWELQGITKKKYDSGGHLTQAKILDNVMVEKKKWTSGGKHSNWEKGRKEALNDRRLYFKQHPDKTDDFSGV